MATATTASPPRTGSPRVSIIVPVLNEAGRLPALLDMLAGLGAHEVIVVDGGSADGSPGAASRAGRAVVMAAGRGRASQMNAGARRAGGDVLLFLHADTRLPPDAVHRVRTAIDEGARWGRFDVRIDDRAAWFRVIERSMNLRSALTGIATGDQALFVRADVFREIDGFPNLALMEDVAISKRLRALSPPARLHGPAVTSARKWRREGVLRTIARMWLLRSLFALGVPASRLHGLYYRGIPGAGAEKRS